MDGIINRWLNGLMDVWMDGGPNGYGSAYCNGYLSTLQVLFLLLKQSNLKVQGDPTSLSIVICI